MLKANHFYTMSFVIDNCTPVTVFSVQLFMNQVSAEKETLPNPALRIITLVHIGR